MKPAAFEYHDPRTVDETVSLMRQYGFDGKVLAGGQSLVPLLNFRLAAPQALVDINRVEGLDYVKEVDGALAIGAVTRQYALETSELIRSHCGLLAETAQLIGHPQIRNRGTICGSICHADPAAELPAVARALDAEMRVASTEGERVIKAEDFFVTLMTTSMEPTEVLLEVRFPALPPRTGWAFEEFAIRHGDFAIAGVTAVITLDKKNACENVRIAAIGVAETPYRDPSVEQLFQGQKVTESLIEQAGQQMAVVVEPTSDLHASAAQRKHLVGVLTARAVRKAADRAAASSQGKGTTKNA
ncbi:MAG: xanthine dehydrogenase family protein subunit M [Acidobacteria bacterium]|nr:xanthine dehydrogenase family protein subunit M [Acidobacteriota bacterium]